MDNLAKIAWGAFVLFSVYQTFAFVAKRFRLNIFFGSWQDLQRVYLVPTKPYFIRFASTSARIGIAEYIGTISIGLAEEGVYFQRNFFLFNKNILYIPFQKFTFVERMPSSWLGNGNIIFTVDGIDVWVAQPYADYIARKTSK